VTNKINGEKQPITTRGPVNGINGVNKTPASDSQNQQGQAVQPNSSKNSDTNSSQGEDPDAAIDEKSNSAINNAGTVVAAGPNSNFKASSSTILNANMENSPGQNSFSPTNYASDSTLTISDQSAAISTTINNALSETVANSSTTSNTATGFFSTTTATTSNTSTTTTTTSNTSTTTAITSSTSTTTTTTSTTTMPSVNKHHILCFIVYCYLFKPFCHAKTLAQHSIMPQR
jgi:hypothetical protein